ncbi:unnamed protein product [Wuchereria bancrofti]|uniref:SRCR domain-containing protein n=1 Tax=Wuchereria bancrofti TaxID=6293 RepID=A0A3P7FX61_WUCBA|nr:unnamed protein product [Wuchereria bancrofti]
MPQFRLIDGTSVRQGRLQIKFQNRWRSICTKLTNNLFPFLILSAERGEKMYYNCLLRF